MKKHIGLFIMLALTITYVLVVLASPKLIFCGHLPVWVTEYLPRGDSGEPLAPNELGDYIAGMFAPLGVAWLIYTLILQRKELALQRAELTGSRKVWEAQWKEQERMALANEKSAVAAHKNMFLDDVRNRKEAIEWAAQRILQKFANFFSVTSGMVSENSEKSLRNMADEFLDSIREINLALRNDAGIMYPVAMLHRLIRKLDENQEHRELWLLHVMPYLASPDVREIVKFITEFQAEAESLNMSYVVPAEFQPIAKFLSESLQALDGKEAALAKRR